MRYKALSPPEKWIIKGIPILFIIGSLMHFLYEISGKNIFVGLISAVNESIWEHSKMVLWPVICWWSIYYMINGKKNNININKWFTAGLIALLTALLTIPMIYYFYTGAFGVEILIIDISILFFAVLFGQILGFHFYKYYKGIKASISIRIFIILILVFAIFTLYPPKLPLFKDGQSGGYGIDIGFKE